MAGVCAVAAPADWPIQHLLTDVSQQEEGRQQRYGVVPMHETQKLGISGAMKAPVGL